MARRELGLWVTHQGAPKAPDVRARLTDVLSAWAGSAAWFQLHGHMRLGQLEALGQLRLLSLARNQHFGGLSSAYYSTALILQGTAHRKMLQIALDHSFVAEQEEPTNVGVLAVRASIYMRQFKFWSARDLYRQVLRSREQSADCEAHAIGEAQCELALAEAELETSIGAVVGRLAPIA